MSSVINLSSLDGWNGFQISGEAEYDYSGYSVSSAGDVNGDGFDDLIIGAPGFKYSEYSYSNRPGASYVVFGHAGGFEANLDLSSLDGTNGFQISGEAVQDYSGASVSSAGDVNGDGFDDLIIGAWGADQSGSSSGASYVVFGQAGGFEANLDLSSLDGSNGFQISGEAASDRSGLSVSSAGDVNGDGFDDLVIGALWADPNGSHSGASYVVFGQAGGFEANLDLSSLDGTNGFQISGEAGGDSSGQSVSSAGDVNGDGFDDLIIGALGADPNGSQTGASYVVFGQAGGFEANLDLSSLDGTNGFQINGEAPHDTSGGSVSSAGDVNGDGFDDLIIGARLADPNGYQSGASYVVFGQAGGFEANLDLSSLDGTNGFQINGEAPFDTSGHSVSSAGDVNGDGFDDLVIGAFGGDPNGSQSGASYVVFGQAGGFEANLDLSSLDGTNGFQISGEAGGDFSGLSVSSAGDVNGDGFDDLVIGAPFAGPNAFYSGTSYVVFGKPSEAVNRIGTAAGEALTGSDFNDIIYGYRGNDTINANNGHDAVAGGGGDDEIHGGGGADYLIGGIGQDAMYGGRGGDTYIVDRAGEAIELANQGTDLVLSQVSYTLGATLENLTLLGQKSLNGTGNELDNTITGNQKTSILTGLSGNDNFVFNTTLTGHGNADIITDMNEAGDDTIWLASSIFTAMGSPGTLDPEAFQSNTTGRASDSSDRIIYETDTGNLYYDSDGSGKDSRGVLFARVDAHLTLAAEDFLVF